MLIFNGKKYFVPFIGSDKVAGADAKPDQVVKGVKFVGANGIVEEGEMPTIALPEATIHFDVDSGRILSVVTNNEDGFVEKGETSAVTYLRTKKAAVIEPSNTTQIAVQKNYWTTGDVTVAPIPDYYIDASDMSVFGNATAADVRKGKSFTSADGVNEEGTMEAASLTNGTGWYRDANYICVEPYVSKGYSDGIYDQWSCDARTLDANLIPANIAEGTSIFGITGTHKGGSEIKTCTVTVNIVDSVGYLGVTATQFANGAITTFRENKSSGTFTIPNVVCGSIITIVCNGYFSIDGWSAPDAVGSTSLALIAPDTTGDYSANIIAYDD